MAPRTNATRLVLASASPRRKRLLEEAGYDFQPVRPPFPEPDERPSGLAPARQAEALAYFKARAVADGNPGSWVLGADTVVALGDDVLGKPADAAEAERMLRRLSGTRHAVITALALLGPAGQRLIASDTTFVTMRKMTAGEIGQYVASGEWVEKAGAYAIQETADRFVVRLEGSFSNVVGLPMELLRRMMDQAGICEQAAGA